MIAGKETIAIGNAINVLIILQLLRIDIAN